MGTFADLIAAHDEEISSPDGNIRARLVGGEIKGLAFAPGTYQRYTDGTLEGQLAALAKLVWVARTKMRRKALREALQLDYEPEPMTPESSQDRKALEEQANTVIDVDTENLRVRVKGGTSWQIRVKPGTVERVSEQMLLREVAMAAKQAMSRWRSSMHQVRDEAYGPNFIYKGMVAR